MFTPRQHSETVIHEIVGDICECFHVQQWEDNDESGVFFIVTNNHRLRGFVDAWLLFLQECEELDRLEEEAVESEGCFFLRLEEKCPIRGTEITKAEFRDAMLLIEFDKSIQVTFHCNSGDCTFMEIPQGYQKGNVKDA
ncbi:hypothetical protein [Roseibium album]|uniref:hypothetical protein n=1 Tax=Roseibium album TaxID=311410 RepID=UPI00391C401A